MATPLQEAPFVLPSVVFRPVRLSIFCAVLAAIAIGLAALAGAVMFGVFFSVGLALGLLNALLVKWSVASIAAEDHPLKRKVALNSVTRLVVITVIALALAYFFRPTGLGVLFGLAVFQVVLVLSTVLPVWQKLRKGEAQGEATEGDGATPAPASGGDQVSAD